MQAVAQRLLGVLMRSSFGQITARHLHGICASTLRRVKRTFCACLGFLMHERISDGDTGPRWRRCATVREMVVLDGGKSGWSARYGLSSETLTPDGPNTRWVLTDEGGGHTPCGLRP